MADKKISLFPAASLPLTGVESVIGVQDGATKQLPAAAIAALAPIQDHGVLTGLGDDDHVQYHTNTRGDARYPPLARTVTAGDGLVGGGTLAADRAFAVLAKPQGGIVATAGGIAIDIAGMNLLGEAVDPVNDLLVVYNASGGNSRAVSVGDVVAGGSGFVATSRQIISGAGLVGGGNLTADRTLAVGAGTGIVVNADDVALDTANNRNVDHSAVVVTAGSGLIGGGAITGNISLALIPGDSRTVDHTTIGVTAGFGLTGGGDATAARTLAVNESVLGAAIATASTIARRDTAGNVLVNAISQGSANNENPTISQVIVTNGTDNIQRKASLAHLLNSLGIGSAAFSGCKLAKTGTQVIAHNTTTGISFDSEISDVGGWHDPGTPNSIVIPTGVTRVRVNARVTINLPDGVAYYDCFLRLRQQGTAIDEVYGQSTGGGTNFITLSLDTGPIACVAGQIFDLFAFIFASSGTANGVIQFANACTMIAFEKIT